MYFRYLLILRIDVVVNERRRNVHRRREAFVTFGELRDPEIESTLLADGLSAKSRSKIVMECLAAQAFSTPLATCQGPGGAPGIPNRMKVRGTLDPA